MRAIGRAWAAARVGGFGVVGVLLIAAPSRAQVAPLEADEAPGHVLGRVCIDEDEDGRCSPMEPGLAGASVYTDDGLRAVTDARGRYHLGDVGRRSLAMTSTGALTRLRHVALRSDTGALGPGAKAAAPVVVPVFPGGVARVDLPVTPPRWREAPSLVVGAETGDGLRLVGRGDGVIARVPALAPIGHLVRVDDADVEVGADGRFVVEVPLGERSGVAHVSDRAPDGRLRVTRVRVARVPRERGGELLVVEEARWLATVDLPPAGAKVAPGALRVPLRLAPGISLSSTGGASRGAEGALLVDVRAGGGALSLALEAPSDDGRELTLPTGLDVDPFAGARVLAFGDLRAGAPVLPPSLAGFAVEGRVASSFELPLDGLPLLDVVGGRVEGVVDVGDAWLADALALDLRYGARGTAGFARFLEDDDVPFFADGSETTALNPAALPFTVRWRADAGSVGVGVARTGLDGGEVGRFDRAVTGPFVDVEQAVGPVTLSARGGADLSLLPLVDGSFARPAHAELLGTGGAVYRLPQRDVVPGSERLWIEVSDPLTGLVRHRRQLLRGRDYDLDYPSGLVLLASPVGREGAPSVGRLSAAGTAFETRVVADYLVSALEPSEGGSFGARLGARVLGVEVGVRGAGDSDTGFVLGGVDVELRPLPWLELSASAADSHGDPFARPDAFLLSRDGGSAWHTPSSPSAGPPTSGRAYAARARVGTDDDGATLWGALREGGYRDGAFASDEGALQLGGEGNLTLGDARFGMFGDWREGPVPKGTLVDGRRAVVRAGAVRVEQPIGRWFTAAVEGHARDVELTRTSALEHGSAAAAGVELTWHAHPHLDLLAAHLQGLYTTGEGPGARDLTFSSLGARFHDDEGRLEARAGLRPDGSVAGAARWSRADDDGGESYGGFELSPDDVFAPRGLSSVSGARQAAAPGTAVFVESRLTDDPVFGPEAGQVVGGEVARGPLRLVAAWQRSRRFLDVTDEYEGVHAQLGLAQRHVGAQAFGEVRRALDDGAVAQWFAGTAARVELVRDLSLGGRVVVGRPGPDERPLSLARVGLAFRSPAWPVLLASYHLRQDLLGAFEGDAPRLRQHIALGSVGVYPWPFLSLLLSTRGRVSEVLDDGGASVHATQAGVVALRAGLLLFDLVEPALEIGARAVGADELPLETDFTTRAEGVVRLGPVRVGLGFVLAGFTGTGLEEPTLDPPARLYAVLQGAL